MSKRPNKKAEADCQVCSSPHDDEIHEATLRSHRWFRRIVVRNFVDDTEYVTEPQLETLGS